LTTEDTGFTEITEEKQRPRIPVKPARRGVPSRRGEMVVTAALEH